MDPGARDYLQGHAEHNEAEAYGDQPAPVLARLNAEVNKLLADPDVQARLERLNNIVDARSAEAFATQVRAEHDANARVVKEAGIKVQ